METPFAALARLSSVSRSPAPRATVRPTGSATRKTVSAASPAVRPTVFTPRPMVLTMLLSGRASSGSSRAQRQQASSRAEILIVVVREPSTPTSRECGPAVGAALLSGTPTAQSVTRSDRQPHSYALRPSVRQSGRPAVRRMTPIVSRLSIAAVERNQTLHRIPKNKYPFCAPKSNVLSERFRQMTTPQKLRFFLKHFAR